MPTVDFWGPTLQGNQQLINVFRGMQETNRQERLDKQQRTREEIDLENRRLQTATARENLADIIKSRKKISEAESEISASGETLPALRKAEIYNKYGLTTQAKNVIDLDEALIKHRSLGENPEATAAAEKGIAHIKAIGEAIKPFMGNPAMLKMLVAAEQAKGNPLFANMDPEKIIPSAQGQGILYPAQRPDPANPGKTIDIPGEFFHIMPDGTTKYESHNPSSEKTVDENPNQTEEQLTARALKGDKEAQAILDAMQKRKLETSRAGAAVMAGEKAKEIDIGALADSIIEGNDAPMAIKGSMGNPVASKVKSEILKRNPKFNMAMSDANYKWKQSATNQRTINFAGGALPRLGALDEQLSKMPNVDINVINRVMREVSVQFGKPEFTNYEANRNAIVQEINTALSGTSQASDLRIKIELDNLQSARSPAQIRGAIENLRMALEARLDVDLAPLYPIEVVRGEKTMEQYKKELYKKYRGHYGTGERSLPVTTAEKKVVNGKSYIKQDGKWYEE